MYVMYVIILLYQNKGEKMKKIQINVDEEIYKQFQKLCIDRGTSVAEEIRNFMNREVESGESADEKYGKEMDKARAALKEFIITDKERKSHTLDELKAKVSQLYVIYEDDMNDIVESFVDNGCLDKISQNGKPDRYITSLC